MANYKTYLSSTFKDLEEYRKAIINLLSHFRETFLLNSMEIYIADDAPTLGKCVEDVKKCDIYILVIGNRYGSLAPHDPLLNPHRKSFTHIEYETARSEGKTVWVYLANTSKAKAGTFAEDPEGPDKAYQQQMLTQFRNDASQRSPVSFSDTLDLVEAVAASIIKRTMTDPEIDVKYIDPNWKHCCDRNEQFIKYEQNRLHPSCAFHLFVGVGHAVDIPANLTVRCAIFSLHLSEENIYSLFFSEFYDDESDEINTYNCLYRLHQQLKPFDNIQKTSIDELKEVIRQHHAPYIVIRMVSDEELTDDKRIRCMAKIFEQLQQICSGGPDAPQKKMYFFWYIQDDIKQPARQQETERKLSLLRDIVAANGTNAVFLKRFSALNREHILSWINNYISVDQFKVQELYDQHFHDLPAIFRMREAEKKIREFFQRIKNKDNNILNILNA